MKASTLHEAASAFVWHADKTLTPEQFFEQALASIQRRELDDFDGRTFLFFVKALRDQQMMCVWDAAYVAARKRLGE